MPITNDSITPAQLQFLAYSVLSETLINKGSVIPQGRRSYFMYNTMMKNAKKQNSLDKGGVRINVKGLREQGYTWWDGTDFLDFEEHYTGEAMTFYVGKGHFGNLLPHDFAERAGIKMDYKSGEGSAVSTDASTRLVNLIKEQADDINFARVRDLGKRMYKSNSDVPKCFTGLLGLHPLVNPTYGDIGGMSRSNRRFQHVVDATAWTADNFQLRLQAWVRSLNTFSNGKSPNVCVIGNDVYDMIANAFSGTSTVAGKFDMRAAQDKAMKAGEKYSIALPQDAFMYGDMVIGLDQTLQELHEDDPSFGWAKLVLAINTDYTYVIPVRKDEHIQHSVPYDQRVSRESWHDEIVMVSTMPNSVGLATTSYAGTSQPW